MNNSRTPLEFLREDNPPSPMVSRVAGATTAPSGTLFSPIKINRGKDATQKSAATIINPSKKPILEDASAKEKSECCESSTTLLKSIDKSLKNMNAFYTQASKDMREEDAEKTEKPPGTGGFMEKAKDTGSDLLEVAIASLGMLFGSNIKSMVDALNDFGINLGKDIENIGKGIDKFGADVVDYMHLSEEEKKKGEKPWYENIEGDILKGIFGNGGAFLSDANKVNAPTTYSESPIWSDSGALLDDNGRPYLDPALKEALMPLIDLIHKAESSNTETGYDSINIDTGKTFKDKDGKTQQIFKPGQMDLSGMTIDEILEKQKNKEFLAAGKYQIEPVTLAEMKDKLKLRGNEKFTNDLQDEIMIRGLITKKPDLANYLFAGAEAGDKRKAAVGTSEIWAGVVNPDKGRGNYDDVANNRASVGAQELYAALGLAKANMIALGAKNKDVVANTNREIPSAGTETKANMISGIAKEEKGGGSKELPVVQNNTTIVQGGVGAKMPKSEYLMVVPPDGESSLRGMTQFF